MQSCRVAKPVAPRWRIRSRLGSTTNCSSASTRTEFDGAAQYRLRLAAFDGLEGLKGLLPASPPQPDLCSLQADFLADHQIERTFGGHQDQPGPLNEPLRSGSRTRDLLKDSFLLFREHDLGCPARRSFLLLKTRTWNITVIKWEEGLFRAMTFLQHAQSTGYSGVGSILAAKSSTSRLPRIAQNRRKDSDDLWVVFAAKTCESSHHSGLATCHLKCPIGVVVQIPGQSGSRICATCRFWL